MASRKQSVQAILNITRTKRVATVTICATRKLNRSQVAAALMGLVLKLISPENKNGKAKTEIQNP